MFALIKLYKQFKDEEEGSMVLFGLYMFSAIILLGGVALSVIAHEETRIRLQNTIDTSVLAAADLNQELDPEAVVVDYFNKTGLSENLKRVEVTESLNSREVLAEAEMNVNTMLLGAIGQTSWTVNSIGAAREDISNIEVSLVLDSSGSMGSYGRMASLQSAAKNFVDDILLTDANGAQSGEVSVNLIPYSTQVSMPQEALDQLTLRHRQSYSGCVDFEAVDFLSTALPSTERAQTAHFDPTYSGADPYQWVCSPADRDEALLFSQDAAELKQRIDQMQPYRWTSIDLGIKWGAAMLDPSARPIVEALIDANLVDAVFSGRPYDLTARNKMKVLVVMTDGANTNQYLMDDAYASGDSDIWYDAATDEWSVFAPEGNQSASLGLDSQITGVLPTWSNGRHGGGITGPQYGGGNGNNGCGIGSGWNNGNYRGGGWNNGGRGHNNCGGDDGDDDDASDAGTDATNDNSNSSSQNNNNVPEDWFIVSNEQWQTSPEGSLPLQQDWQEVWANVTVEEQADEFRYDQNNDWQVYQDWSDIYSTVGQSEKDARMADICTAAKDAGIIIFTMGFEIGDSNAAKMRNCASSANYYFDVDYDTIDLAFAAIANSINMLRLIQ